MVHPCPVTWGLAAGPVLAQGAGARSAGGSHGGEDALGVLLRGARGPRTARPPPKLQLGSLDPEEFPEAGSGLLNHLWYFTCQAELTLF